MARTPGISSIAEQVQARLVELADQYHSLEVLCEQGSNFDLPCCGSDAKSFGFPAAARLARRVRNDLGLGDRPGQALLRVLEEVCNVKVFHLDFEPSGTAACTLTERYGAAVLLNARNAPWRRTFDLAHELFHLLTWRIFRHLEIGNSGQPSLAGGEVRDLLCSQSSHAGGGVPGSCGFYCGTRLVESMPTDCSRLRGSSMYRLRLSSGRWGSCIAFLRKRSGFTWIDSRAGWCFGTVKLKQLRRHVLTVSKPWPAKRLRKGLISTGSYATYVGISRRDAMKVVEEDAVDDVQIEVAHP